MPEETTEIDPAEKLLSEMVDGPLLEYIEKTRPDLLGFFKKSLVPGHIFGLPLRAAFIAGNRTPKVD